MRNDPAPALVGAGPATADGGTAMGGLGLSRRRFAGQALSAIALSLLGVLPVSRARAAEWALLPRRPVPWTMKPLSSAKTRETVVEHDRVELRVEHELLRGVNPAMLAWWWRNLDGEVDLFEKKYPRYLIWHPADHIHLTTVTRAPDGGAGTVIHIVEALGGDMGNLVDVQLHLREVGERAIVAEVVTLNYTVVRIHGEITAQPDGTRIVTTMTLGFTSPPTAWLNSWLIDRYFPPERRNAWLKHCVEEIGNLEFFLPPLYRQHA